MNLSEDFKKSLSLSNSTSTLNDQSYKKLIEYCFLELVDNQSPNITPPYNSKADVVKELHASFLTAIAYFARHGCASSKVAAILQKDCGLSASRANYLAEFFEKNRTKLQMKLGNIGTHLPHIVDVEWKIDYIVKTGVMDESDGPIFRVTLVTEQHDSSIQGKKVDHIRFSCNTEELQDLVYKLKDAVRHCQKIGNEH